MIIVNETIANILRDVGMVEGKDFMVDKPLPRGWDAKAATRKIRSQKAQAA
jgi:hypothetical protein